MKKIICMILLISLLLQLTACTENSQSENDVHVFYYTYSDTYISSVRNALGKTLSKHGLKYQDHDANGNQTTQTEQIQTAITKGAKLIIVNIVNTGSDDAAIGIINLAKNAGIPVIFFNREISDKVIESYDKCIFIGTDAKEAGYMQGDMIGDYLVSNFEKTDLNKDGKISYILFKGEEGNNEAIYRSDYSVENANKKLVENSKPKLEFYDSSNPNKYLVDKNGQWSAASSNEYMTTALTSYNEANSNMIELVICNNDGMAEGAITALGSVGFNTGGDKKIPVFGVDATDAAKELIKQNKMTGTIKQDADAMAEMIGQTSKNSLDNKGFLDGIKDANVDDSGKKVRIPYSKYLG